MNTAPVQTDFGTRAVITYTQALRMKKEKKADNGRPRDAYFYPHSLQKAGERDPNPAETHEFLQSLCCSVLINSH